MSFRISIIICLSALLWMTGCSSDAAQTSPTHPRLVSTADEIVQMRTAISQPGRFAERYLELKQAVDKEIEKGLVVPIPKDAGGGYTHEQHKKNYQLMNNAGIIYQMSQDLRYAEFVRDMLLAYAEFYPDLGFHPKRKEQSPGKLFWQSLNEAVWLVYTAQAYDYVKPAISHEAQAQIESRVLRPMALFLSEESPQTFNKVHNHGTWANAAVGMAGFVLDELEWVEKSLYGLDKSGNAGFLKQLDVLFSPDGYYNEGPYYQRYALMPFVLFAKAVEQNQPERKIFEHRDGIILKAINTTVQLSYNKLFFGINDAIKDKGIDTIELVYGITIAYGLTGDTGLLSIADSQDQVLLTGDGLNVAEALDKGLATPYQFVDLFLGDGAEGKDGGLIIMRDNIADDHQALVFKATSQGLGHGHFDKLNYLYFDNGDEIVRDYGAARFLNIEAKYGGHYLPENNAYAKQTIAHNTLVVDETSHFNGNVRIGNQRSPVVDFVNFSSELSIAKSTMKNAYDDVTFDRTMAMVNIEGNQDPLIFDILNVQSDTFHQYDLPVHYLGQFISTSIEKTGNFAQLSPLGEQNGYQYLWRQASGESSGNIAQVTVLNKDKFYTHTSLTTSPTEFIFGQTGANDPNFNLVHNRYFLQRVNASNHQFVNVLESHGEYNGTAEFTKDAYSSITDLNALKQGDLQLITFMYRGQPYVFAYNVQDVDPSYTHRFSLSGQPLSFSGQAALIPLKANTQ
jgi:hypothetical protein